MTPIAVFSTKVIQALLLNRTGHDFVEFKQKPRRRAHACVKGVQTWNEERPGLEIEFLRIQKRLPTGRAVPKRTGVPRSSVGSCPGPRHVLRGL